MSEQYEVLAVRYGTRQASAAEVFLNYHAYREPDRPLRMDYYFWVARSPARTVVIDTGFSPAGGAARGRTMLLGTVPALTTAGTTPDAVAQVVLTHAHYDHIGGLPVFTSAEILMTRDEYDFWAGPMGRRGQFAHTTEAGELAHLRELRATGRLTLTGQAHAVAPGIELTQVGGHTPGQAIVTVATREGPVILAWTRCTTTRSWSGTGRSRPWRTSRTCTRPSTRSASWPRVPASSPVTIRWWPNGSPLVRAPQTLSGYPDD